MLIHVVLTVTRHLTLFFLFRNDKSSLWCNLKSDVMAKHCKTLTAVCSNLQSDYCEVS